MMRFILAALFALLVLPASADLRVNQLIGFGGGGGATTLTYIASYVDTGASPYTFNVSLGEAAAGRKMLFGTDTEGTGSSRTVSSAKLHVPSVAADPTGTTCSQVAGVSVTANAVALLQCDRTDGTSGQLVVTWSGVTLRSGLGVWRATNASSTATVTDSTDPLSQSLTVPSGGFVVAIGAGITATSFSWGSALTEKYDEIVESSAYHTGASAEFTTGGAQTIAVTPNSFDQHVMCAAAFGPS